jgi:hypothetical protein
MGFFEEETEPPPPMRAAETPIWAGPQKGVLPGYSDQSEFVFHSDDGALAVHGFEVYPNGLLFRATFWERRPDPHSRESPFVGPFVPRIPTHDGFVRFGVLFDDGSRWTNLQQHAWTGEPPPAPFVSQLGGGGHDGTWTVRHWIWPIPDGQRLVFVGAWPKFDIPESTASVDLEELRSRLAHVKSIWD